jgi:opine dehydrogenase
MATIGIVGAGPGGLRLCAHLGLAGHTVRLNDIDDKPLALVRTRGGVDVEHLDGTPWGFAPVEKATTRLAETVEGAGIVIVVSGGNTHARVAQDLAKRLEDGQLVLLIQGNTGGSLLVRRELDRAACTAKIVLCEMDCYPHAMRRPEPTRFRRTTDKRWLQIAAFPASDTAQALDRLKPLFPQIVAAPDVLHTGFTNMNAVLHCANCISNAAHIENGGGYKFYGEGVTPAIARLYEAVDQDRLAVARALGVQVLGLADWFERVYGVREATLVDTIKRLSYDDDGAYVANRAAGTLDHKYVTEDVPTGLMPMAALGDAVGVDTPAIDAVIAIAQFQLGRTFEAEARTLDRLGIAGLARDDIIKTAREGFR